MPGPEQAAWEAGGTREGLPGGRSKKLSRGSDRNSSSRLVTTYQVLPVTKLVTCTALLSLNETGIITPISRKMKLRHRELRVEGGGLGDRTPDSGGSAVGMVRAEKEQNAPGRGSSMAKA